MTGSIPSLNNGPSVGGEIEVVPSAFKHCPSKLELGPQEATIAHGGIFTPYTRFRAGVLHLPRASGDLKISPLLQCTGQLVGVNASDNTRSLYMSLKGEIRIGWWAEE